MIIGKWWLQTRPFSNIWLEHQSIESLRVTWECKSSFTVDLYSDFIGFRVRKRNKLKVKPSAPTIFELFPEFRLSVDSICLEFFEYLAHKRMKDRLNLRTLKSNLGWFPGIYSRYFNQLVVNDFPFAFEWFSSQDIPEWKIKQDTVYPICIPSCQYLKNFNL